MADDGYRRGLAVTERSTATGIPEARLDLSRRL